MLRFMRFAAAAVIGIGMSLAAVAADQTQIGDGNTRARDIGGASPLVRSAKRLIIENANKIEDRKTREATLDAVFNANTCIAHRAGLTEAAKEAIIQQLERA